MSAEPAVPRAAAVAGVGEVQVRTAGTHGSGPSTVRRLRGVDGLRALAAFWVVFFHIRSASGARVPGAPLDLFIRSGSTGVSLFLVISGFSLYIPYANGKTARFRTRDFLWRRCRRLLPAYFVSLAILVPLIAVAGRRAGFEPFSGAGLLGQTVAHLTLVHQLFPRGFYSLNGAYWSLGLEWELYLTLPLLIFIVRRIGIVKALAIVIGVNAAYRLGLQIEINRGLAAPHGLLATAVLPNFFLGRWAEFALGMAAAELYVAGQIHNEWLRRLRYGVLIVVPIALLTVGNPLNHLLFGFVFFVLVCVVLDGDNVLARISSWAPLVVLGTMSYSIYLVHQPMLLSAGYLLGQGGASPRATMLGLVALIPVIVALAWLLFVTVERRTVNGASFAGMPGAFLLLLGRKGVTKDPDSKPTRWRRHGPVPQPLARNDAGQDPGKAEPVDGVASA